MEITPGPPNAPFVAIDAPFICATPTVPPQSLRISRQSSLARRDDPDQLTLSWVKNTATCGLVGDRASRVVFPVRVMVSGMASQARAASAVWKVLRSMLHVALEWTVRARAERRRAERKVRAILFLGLIMKFVSGVGDVVFGVGSSSTGCVGLKCSFV